MVEFIRSCSRLEPFHNLITFRLNTCNALLMTILFLDSVIMLEQQYIIHFYEFQLRQTAIFAVGFRLIGTSVHLQVNSNCLFELRFCLFIPSAILFIRKIKSCVFYRSFLLFCEFHLYFLFHSIKLFSPLPFIFILSSFSNCSCHYLMVLEIFFLALIRRCMLQLLLQFNTPPGTFSES